MSGLSKTLSIASVTLAYNSARFLGEQLDALLRQTRSLDEIVVINNASQDTTLKVLSERYPQVTVINLPSNMGVGGGYATGLTYAALQRKHDWVWLLDHDSVPDDEGLEVLLHAITNMQGSEPVGILASCPVNPGTDMAYPGILWKEGMRPPRQFWRQPISFVDAVISSGSLVNREAVQQAGLPRTDFFIDFVDFEYCLRLRNHGYSIAVVRDSHLCHAIGTPRVVKILGFSYAWTEQPPWREYYSTRNFTYTVWNLYGDWKIKFLTVKRLLRHAIAIAVFGSQKFACFRMMFSGFIDGIAGRLGIRNFGKSSQENYATESGTP